MPTPAPVTKATRPARSVVIGETNISRPHRARANPVHARQVNDPSVVRVFAPLCPSRPFPAFPPYQTSDQKARGFSESEPGCLSGKKAQRFSRLDKSLLE